MMPTSASDKELIGSLLYYLNKVEISDNDREFRPNTISSCRVLDTQAMSAILKEMEARVPKSDRKPLGG